MALSAANFGRLAGRSGYAVTDGTLGDRLGRMPISKRILLVVDELDSGVADVPAAVSGLLAGEGVRVLVTSPALNSRLRSLVSDADDALGEARERIEAVLRELRRAGIHAEETPWVGDEDPLQAIDDVVRTHAVNEIVLVVNEANQENFRERDLAGKARARFACPVHEVVVH